MGGGLVTPLAPLTGTTGSFSVPAMSAGSCAVLSSANNATVSGAQIGQPVIATLTGAGALYFPTGLYQVQAAVTAANTVTVQVCAVVTTSAASPSVQFNVAVQ